MQIEDLKKLRLAAGLTQVEVAKAVGVTMTAYQNWERGANKPSDENYEKLMQVLKKE